MRERALRIWNSHAAISWLICVFCECDFVLIMCFVKMDEDQWMYDNIMSKEVDMNE